MGGWGYYNNLLACMSLNVNQFWLLYFTLCSLLTVPEMDASRWVQPRNRAGEGVPPNPGFLV